MERSITRGTGPHTIWRISYGVAITHADYLILEKQPLELLFPFGEDEMLLPPKRQEGFWDILQKVRPKNVMVIRMSYQILTAAGLDRKGTFREVMSLEDFIS